MQTPAVSPRELAVLELLGEHLTHAEIAARLFISVRTVESHVASMRRKLALPDHRSLVKYAADLGQRPALPAPTLPDVALTPFVGRQRELAELTALLAAHRLVSAVGAGGAGKTRLAIEAARASAQQRVDGMLAVALAPVADAGGLDDALASACGAEASSLQDVREAAVSALRERDLVLLLDNCEHLVQPVALLAERILHQCPRVTVLVTSRVRLVLPFEQVYRVPGLSSDADGDAVALFLQRSASAGAPLADADRPRVAGICAGLGGLALAVELAASRVPALGLAGVERGLGDAAHLLSGGSRLAARHQSMRATLDWSAGLLGDDGRTTLRRLSAFATTFDADAAAAVAAHGALPEDGVRRALGELVEHSLLTPVPDEGGALRYRYLEPVRQYAESLLADDRSETHARHLDWCIGRLDRAAAVADPDELRRALAAAAPDVASAWGRVAGGQPPPAGAHRLARDHARLQFRAGALPAAQRWWEAAAAAAPGGVVAALDLAAAAAVAKCQVRGEEALRLECAAAVSAERGGDARLAALAYARAAGLVARFAGMFATPVSGDVRRQLVDDATRLAPADTTVAATLSLADFAVPGPGVPMPDVAAIVARVRAVGDPVLESAAFDLATALQLSTGAVSVAARLAAERVAALPAVDDRPEVGLEVKDALHVAVYTACGAGDLVGAADFARQQAALPFLHEQRDVADEELLAPAALSGHWATMLRHAALFLADWTAAGRPVAPGRAQGPAAVAMAHGLRGDTVARAQWLDVVAAVRGVAAPDAMRATGFGELFDAVVLLHDGDGSGALALAAGVPPGRLYGLVYREWLAAVAAEAAVVAGAAGADGLVAAAQRLGPDNPVVAAMTRRAGALADGDLTAVAATSDDFARLAMPYQSWRSLALAGSVAPITELDRLELPG